MITLHRHKLRAFSAPGVLIGLVIIAAMAASVVVLVASNQSTRVSGLQTAKAFYSSHAGLEYVMRQILSDGNPNPIPTRYFNGTLLEVSRTCNRVNITTTSGNASNTFSIADPGQLCAIEGSATPSSNSAPFNGQSIAQGQYIWFNMVFNVSGLSLILTHVYLENSNVLFTANGINYNIVTPSAVVTFDPNATCVSTNYVAGQWHTTVPIVQIGDIFVTGTGFYVPVNLPGSISPVTWNATFASDQEGLSTHWTWGAAVYTTSLQDLNSLGVKASDKDTCGDPSNDKAATPSNIKTYLTNGARSGGGSNYTGGGTGTTGTIVQCLSGC